MEVSSVAAASLAMSQASQAYALQMAVLKQAIEMEAQVALQLLEMASAASNPAHLGTLIDTRA